MRQYLRYLSPPIYCGFLRLVTNQDTYTGQIVAALFDSQQLKLGTTMSTNYLETIKMMVSIGLGWSVLPATMFDDGLKAIEIKGTPLQRPLGYVYHRNRTLSNAAAAMIDALQDHCATI